MLPTPGALRTRRYRERHKAQGLCCNCPRPVVNNSVLCARCRAKAERYKPTFLKNQRKIRAYRSLLGFCSFCKRRPVPGLKVCAKHQKEHAAATQRYRDKKVQKRGWKLARVKV